MKNINEEITPEFNNKINIVSSGEYRKGQNNTEINFLSHKIKKYFDVTSRALKKAKISTEKKINWKSSAEDFLDMANRYFSDAQHFYSKGDWVNAFACINYAHGWLDAGARLGLFDVEHDSELFTVD